MPTSKYISKSGKRLPSVTTILGSWGNPEGLFRWANGLAIEGIDAIGERDRLARVGSVVHDIAAQCLLGVDFEEAVHNCDEDIEEDSINEVQSCLSGWQRFMEQFGCFLKVHAVEEHLISETYGYGGTPDAVLHIGDVLVVMDLKTGKIRPSMAMQLAAYRELWTQEAKLTERMSGVILHLDREDGGFQMRSISPMALDLAFEMFLSIKKIREQEQVLRRMV